MIETVIDLVRVFALLSILSLGGGNAVLAEMQRQVVAHHWTTAKQFLDFYAISRVAPGPGMQLVTLIGWQAAGVVGAFAASLAMFVPSSLGVYLVTTIWGRLPESRGKQAVEHGLAPLAIGLTLASVLTLLHSSTHPIAATITAVVSTALLIATKINPLWMMTAAGLIFLAAG
jgi:chromate transporter